MNVSRIVFVDLFGLFSKVSVHAYLIDLFQSIRGMIADFQNPNNTQYKFAHVYFTEGTCAYIL